METPAPDWLWLPTFCGGAVRRDGWMDGVDGPAEAYGSEPDEQWKGGCVMICILPTYS